MDRNWVDRRDCRRYSKNHEWQFFPRRSCLIVFKVCLLHRFFIHFLENCIISVISFFCLLKFNWQLFVIYFVWNYSCNFVFAIYSEPQGMCYVETANLDGETNLKIRQVSFFYKLAYSRSLFNFFIICLIYWISLNRVYLKHQTG